MDITENIKLINVKHEINTKLNSRIDNKLNSIYNKLYNKNDTHKIIGQYTLTKISTDLHKIYFELCDAKYHNKDAINENIIKKYFYVYKKYQKSYQYHTKLFALGDAIYSYILIFLLIFFSSIPIVWILIFIAAILYKMPLYR